MKDAKKNTHMRIPQLLVTMIIFMMSVAMPAHAQQGMSLTVSPPLFQFTLTPGNSWASSIKVSNGNSYDITIYATPVHFNSIGEAGKGIFTPLSNNESQDSRYTLASWIDVTEDPIIIPKGRSTRIPFFVETPEDAQPGGHYAAILIGTRPIDQSGQTQIKVSSLISALLFARVAGDVVEEGKIREFSTEKVLYQRPRAEFTLRFENTGNVHVVPRGDIVIYNMWGKERGRIDVNKSVDFGNVFPDSVRKFSFTWEGESNFYDIGRYKAISTLSYGVGASQNDFRVIYFWVIPVKPLLWIGGTLLLFILFIVLSIRRYVRHALEIQTQMLSKNAGASAPHSQHPSPQTSTRRMTDSSRTPVQTQQMPARNVAEKIRVLKQPIVQSSIDLRRMRGSQQNTQTMHKPTIEPLTTGQLLKKYRLFLFYTVGFILMIVVMIIFFRQVMSNERDFNIEIKENIEENKPSADLEV
jgi:hypothetical protein